jgi:hypothetical protein
MLARDAGLKTLQLRSLSRFPRPDFTPTALRDFVIAESHATFFRLKRRGFTKRRFLQKAAKMMKR